MFEVTIKGLTPILQHKFNGQEEEKKIKKLSDKERAEKHAYRMENGELYVPGVWLSQALKNAYVAMAPSKQKTAYKRYIAARLTVLPLEISLGRKSYKIDKRDVPSQMGKRACRDFTVRPRIENWEITFRVNTTLNEEELRKIIEFAGTDIGIGAGRPLGFGRFKLMKLKKL